MVGFIGHRSFGKYQGLGLGLKASEGLPTVYEGHGSCTRLYRVDQLVP